MFKVVSAAALVESGVVGQHAHLLPRRRLVGRCPTTWSTCPRIDRRCDTLAYGLGKSQNAILAKLATRHLTAARAGPRRPQPSASSEAIPFELPVEPSHLDVPADGLEFARTAAGFWHSTLSPMHGALLAATIANRGEMPAPTLIDRAVDRGRAPAGAARRRARARSSTPAAAREVGRMMELTTRIGTAKGTFRDKRGRRAAARRGRRQDRHAVGARPTAATSATAGSSATRRPTARRIAFAVVLGNHPSWRIKATYVGRHIVDRVSGGARRPSGARDAGVRSLEHAPARLLAAESMSAQLPTTVLLLWPSTSDV